MTKIEPEEQRFDPREWSDEAARTQLQLGVRLFNEGQYHPAHEAFERLWLSTEGADSDCFKGLIQACIALHHFQRGNLDGAAKLYSGHRALLAPYLPTHLGLDLAAFLLEMQRVLRPVVRRLPGSDVRFDPEQRPSLRSTTA